MYPSRYWGIALIAILLTNCTTNQNVPGALPTKSPYLVTGAGAGAVVGATAGALVAQTKSLAPSIMGGAMLGAAMASYMDTEGLVKKLNHQGVTVIRIGDSTDIIIPLDLVFLGGDTDMKREAYPLLNDIVKYIKQYGKAPITVTAHSDNVDGMLQRLARTEKQAQHITTYLWSQGINLQRMEFMGIADLETVADMQSATGAGYNRRIQISIWREDFRAPSPLYLYTANQNEDFWKTDNPDMC